MEVDRAALSLPRGSFAAFPLYAVQERCAVGNCPPREKVDSWQALLDMALLLEREGRPHDVSEQLSSWQAGGPSRATWWMGPD